MGIEEETTDEDWDMTRTQADQQEDIDLFDDGDGPQTSTSKGTHRQNVESNDTQCGFGKWMISLVCHM